MPRRPGRSALGLHNLAPVTEEAEVSPLKSQATVLTPPPPPPEGPTPEELAEADRELARMEADLAKTKVTKTIIDDDSESSESSSDEEDTRRWSTARRSSRRSSVQHLTPKERAALRRLSTILRDNGASRRAQERRDSLVARQEAKKVDEERRRKSDRRRRMQSIAKLIDLSLVWHWLERVEVDSDSDDDDESIAEQDLRDTEAVAIVESLAAGGGLTQALAKELQLDIKDASLKTVVLKTLRDLTDLRVLRASVAAYDAHGFYNVHVHLGDRGLVVARRSWRDFGRLRRGLEDRGMNKAVLPKLPRPRAVSSAKKVFRNVLSVKGRKGDRIWEKAKVPVLDAWLTKVIALVSTQNASLGTNTKLMAGYCRSAPEEHLEDFLFKFATVLADHA